MEVAGEAKCMDNCNPICSICYEDFHLIVEDLQAIYVCGHVFHEICLQQWFEYCSKGKHSCPVCKQRCKDKDVGRLYFQSLSESDGSIKSQKQSNQGQDFEDVRMKNRRLEDKVSGLSSVLEQRQQDLKELSNELLIWKEAVKSEVTLKNEAIQQVAFVQGMIRSKSEDLENSTLECFRLKERNISLAKELASLKLVYDFNLEEEDVLKLASFGSSGTKDTIDVLRKSLVGRNRNYKELIAKCNLLGRRESKCLKKLEKAKEKIKLLKARVQGLERDSETKEMEALRVVKASAKGTSQTGAFSTMVNGACDIFTTNHLSPPVVKGLESIKNGDAGLVEPRKPCAESEKEPFIMIEDDDGLEEAVALGAPDTVMGVAEDDSVRDSTLPAAAMAADTQVEKEASPGLFQEGLANSSGIPQGFDGCTLPGDRVFAGGLMSSDGMPRYLGKWCKRVQSKGPPSACGMGSGHLIAVGADGRGGCVKVLRSISQSPLKEHMTSNKKSRSLPIEHFFGRVGRR